MAEPTNQGIFEAAMKALIDEQRLLRPTDLWGVRNEHETRVAELSNALVFAPWHGAEFLQPQPEALAYAADEDVARVVEWTQKTLDCVVEADIARPNSAWTISELSSRCGLPERQLAVGLLFLRFLVAGCNPVDIDDTGRPTGAQLVRAVRTAPRETLNERVEHERRGTT